MPSTLPSATSKPLTMAKELEETNKQVALLVSSYNHHIRPLLNVIDRLYHLQVMTEGIQLPTIMVVGNQSSDKSSILESLAGINLPHRQGICTHVPLVMHLQDDTSVAASKPRLQLGYRDKVVPTTKASIADAINAITKDIADDSKCISGETLTLDVKKKGVSDLTMVDLPGITRVLVHGQPEDIYEQISNIMKYITP